MSEQPADYAGAKPSDLDDAEAIIARIEESLMLSHAPDMTRLVHSLIGAYRTVRARSYGDGWRAGYEQGCMRTRDEFWQRLAASVAPKPSGGKG